jgi:outer membrane lipoprotein-sorting protein
MSLPEIVTRVVLGLAPAPVPANQAFVPTAPLVAAPTASTVPVAPALPATAAGVVDRVQQFYARIQQVTARFHQAVTYETYGTTKDSTGTVMVMKPGKMRWDYADKKLKNGIAATKKTVISNGASVYIVEHDNKQVLKQTVQQDLMPVAVSFLYGKGDLKAAFTPELDTTGTYGAKDDLVLKLTPRQPSAQYKNLYLVVSSKDFHVSQSVIIDSSNNVNRFEFLDPDFETPIQDATFELDPRSVKDYRVIDGDALRAPTQAPAPPARK